MTTTHTYTLVLDNPDGVLSYLSGNVCGEHGRWCRNQPKGNPDLRSKEIRKYTSQNILIIYELKLEELNEVAGSQIWSMYEP